jgi:hypothetical protein
VSIASQELCKLQVRWNDTKKQQQQQSNKATKHYLVDQVSIPESEEDDDLVVHLLDALPFFLVGVKDLQERAVDVRLINESVLSISREFEKKGKKKRQEEMCAVP